MDTNGANTEQRTTLDRREFSWQTVVFGFARSRRQTHRRSDDDGVGFHDWHHPWLFFLATGTMLLSCADAFLTLQLLDRGMIEANPVMRVVLSHSVFLFTSIKLSLTGLGILILVSLAKSRFLNRFRTGVLLTALFSFYCCLVCYELVNLFALM